MRRQVDGLRAAGDVGQVGAEDVGDVREGAGGERGDDVKGISIDRFDSDGKIAESWAQWDVMTFMRNIGAVPSGAEATA